MAYTLFDLAALMQVQKTLASRIYDRSIAGRSVDDVLYGDDFAIGSGTALSRVNDRISAAAGNDQVYGGVGNDYLDGGLGNDFLDGGDGDDLLVGGVGNDVVYAGNGADFLDGGAGVDEMRGGKGDDIYNVDNALDRVTESLDAGTDTVLSSASFTLGSNLEKLILTGSAAINATGNDLDNILYGNAGINILKGGIGNDQYYVQNTTDVVDEVSASPNLEWNIVFSSATFSLLEGSQIDEFILTGAAGVKAYGNSGSNLIEGNAGSNYIYGAGGDDTLSGVPLDVTVAEDFSQWTFITALLSDDQGADVLYGGLGDDIMFLGKTDRIVEKINEGIDTAVCGYSHVLEENVENLDFYGKLGSTEALQGTGNALDNYITSNLGADTLIGKLGDDTYEVFNSGVVVTELANQGVDIVMSHVDFRLSKFVENLVLLPNQTGFTPLVGFGNDLSNNLSGNAGDNVLYGQGGDDLLYGGLGSDQLTGGVGVDSFVFDTELDAEDNLDTIHDFHSGQDRIVLDSHIFSSLTSGGVSLTDFLLGAGGGAAPDQTANNEHLLFDTDSGTLFYDVDGSGGESAVAFAVLYPGINGYSVANTDFVVI